MNRRRPARSRTHLAKPTVTLRRMAMNSAQKYGVSSEDDLQQWIDDMASDGKATSTIKCYVACWCRENDARADELDIAYPKPLIEIKYTPTKSDLESLLEQRPKWAPPFQFLISSGLRIGELTQLTPADVTAYEDRWRLHLPARITKTGKARITFSSYPLPEDYSKLTNNKLGKRFATMRREAGLLQMTKVGVQPRYALHIHGLRAYFITALDRIQFGIGHEAAGHDYYMSTYNKYSDKDIYEYHKQADDMLRIDV